MNTNDKKKKVESEKNSLYDEQDMRKEFQDATGLSEDGEENANLTDTDRMSSYTKKDGGDFEQKYYELNDSYLRLMAEFDNYRKRTIREKAELIKNGGELVLTKVLPVADDLERAIYNMRNTNDPSAIVEGIELIYNKFISYLAQQGVKPIEAVGKPFDTELFEAVATIPAPDESLKGKVIECLVNGYTLNDKVIRHAKVVVGE